MIAANRLSYLRSLSNELDVQANRVRQLIGSRHWATDGTHKEALLEGLLRRHVPAAHALSKGFVVSETDDAACSREQDVLVVDTLTEAPAFHQHGLVIAFPEQVRAAISVKSEYSSTVLERAVEDLCTVGEVCPPTSRSDIWLGLYFFSTASSLTTLRSPLEAIQKALDKGVNRTCVTELVVRATPDVLLRCAIGNNNAHAWAYRIPDLATSCFLGRLLSWLAIRRNSSSSFDALLADLETPPNQVEHIELS